MNVPVDDKFSLIKIQNFEHQSNLPVLPIPALQCTTIGGPLGSPFQLSLTPLNISICCIRISLINASKDLVDVGDSLSAQLVKWKCDTFRAFSVCGHSTLNLKLRLKFCYRIHLQVPDPKWGRCPVFSYFNFLRCHLQMTINRLLAFFSLPVLVAFYSAVFDDVRHHYNN